MSLGDWKVSGGWGKNGQWKANHHETPAKQIIIGNKKKTNYHERLAKQMIIEN